MTVKQDQNFDNLSVRFRENIYSTAKGRIRLNILWRDLLENIPNVEQGGLDVLDAGAGQGHFSLMLTEKNHHLTLSDISSKMLEQAKLLFSQQRPNSDVRFIHASVQNLGKYIDKKYDLVLFHAVLEWLAEPEKTLKEMLQFIKPGGYLSLMFYSRTGLIYQNLTRGNFSYVLNNTLAGKGKTLTPTNPQNPDDVYAWLKKENLKIITKSGVRVFYDGIHRERRKDINENELFELERRFSRIEPYCSLARYIHVLCQKAE